MRISLADGNKRSFTKSLKLGFIYTQKYEAFSSKINYYLKPNTAYSYNFVTVLKDSGFSKDFKGFGESTLDFTFSY